MSHNNDRSTGDNTPLLMMQPQKSSTSSMKYQSANTGGDSDGSGRNSRRRKLKVASRRYDVHVPRRKRSTELMESLIRDEDIRAGRQAGMPGTLEKWEVSRGWRVPFLCKLVARSLTCAFYSLQFPGWGVQRCVPDVEFEDMEGGIVVAWMGCSCANCTSADLACCTRGCTDDRIAARSGGEA